MKTAAGDTRAAARIAAGLVAGRFRNTAPRGGSPHRCSLTKWTDADGSERGRADQPMEGFGRAKQEGGRGGGVDRMLALRLAQARVWRRKQVDP